MTRVRDLSRGAFRCTVRHTTRRLEGARRPPPPNYFSLACHAIEEVIRIDKRLRPFMDEQKRIVEEYMWMQPWEEAIREVYGAPDPAAPKPQHSVPAAVDIRQLRKDEQALAKTQALVADLRAKLTRNR